MLLKQYYRSALMEVFFSNSIFFILIAKGVVNVSVILHFLHNKQTINKPTHCVKMVLAKMVLAIQKWYWHFTRPFRRGSL